MIVRQRFSWTFKIKLKIQLINYNKKNQVGQVELLSHKLSTQMYLLVDAGLLNTWWIINTNGKLPSCRSTGADVCFQTVSPSAGFKRKRFILLWSTTFQLFYKDLLYYLALDWLYLTGVIIINNWVSDEIFLGITVMVDGHSLKTSTFFFYDLIKTLEIMVSRSFSWNIWGFLFAVMLQQHC